MSITVDPADFPRVLDSIRIRHQILCHSVQVALFADPSDVRRLRLQHQEVLDFDSFVEQHQDAIPVDELNTAHESIENMLAALDNAIQRDQSSDPPELAVSWKNRTEVGPGRPRIEISREYLEVLTRESGPTGIAKRLSCSSRTVRRRALEYGLVDPTPPVYTDEVQADDSVLRTYRSYTRAVSILNDEGLDRLVASVLESFPDYGRRRMKSALIALGHNVPARRLTQSLNRVRQVPLGVEGSGAGYAS